MIIRIHVRWLQLLSVFLCMAGLALTGWAAWEWTQTEFIEAAQRRLYQEAIDEAAATQLPQRKSVGLGETVGILRVDRLNLEVLVRHGADAATLKKAAGHIPGTSLPGQEGTVGIGAHRDTYFRPLKNIRAGDRIRLTTTDGQYLYEVDSTAIVTPDRVDVLDPGEHPRLTLVTCYPFYYVGSAPNRFIVQARLVEQESHIEAALAANSGS